MENLQADLVQFDRLDNTLAGMTGYLDNVERAYQTLEFDFQSEQRANSLEKLLNIMEGLDYCKKMLYSAASLLEMDVAENLCGELSIASFANEMICLFKQIDTAAENGDYSLVADLSEYDIVPVIQKVQQLLVVLKARCTSCKGLELVNGGR